MTFNADRLTHVEDQVLASLGAPAAANLYLDRCQVDTPDDIVTLAWRLIGERRSEIGTVVDFGAGDGRFARQGIFQSYTGYEIDRARYQGSVLPANARMINACAFSSPEHYADLACGNPPFVRNQDLPFGWRHTAAKVIADRTGVRISGLANAWQYFFLLSLASTAEDGLIALVVPYEWVSRPSSRAMREYIQNAGWDVYAYRLHDTTFSDVLTTSSITIIDKRGTGTWKFFQQTCDGSFELLMSPSGKRNILEYSRAKRDISVKRGLSPGTQVYLTLTEAERLDARLKVGRDVVPCVTSLKPTAAKALSFTPSQFERDYVAAGNKCWLVRTDRLPSNALLSYLDSVPTSGRQTSTCTKRDVWWAFAMPTAPQALLATGYTVRPKVVVNDVGAVAVGSVCGIYGPSRRQIAGIVRKLREVDYDDRVVSHSHGLRKLEISQINALIGELNGDATPGEGEDR
ncbi:hypothetical protein XA1311A_19440 [Xanthomonas arboricola]|uniref:hypothetical protein n=1 Tax=Xanthomonas arboricola TaxID=56448 RepID=UPI001E2F8D69|nr:hypothetical protein [Xanthomonas arboricola]CAE6762173.1 hypothetical protein XA1311A_19440 [Xanthomonas arboricola]CAE6762207.1 hypothetical protein XA1311A_19440 [Xanthomonas arboricola]